MPRWYARLVLFLATRTKTPFAGPRVENLYYEAVVRHGLARIAVTLVKGIVSRNFDEMGEFAT